MYIIIQYSLTAYEEHLTRSAMYSVAKDTYFIRMLILIQQGFLHGAVKPVYNDHLYNKIYCLWFIQ